MFAFPPLLDARYDQPQSEVVIDRDKVAALGLNLQQVGGDLSAAMSGNYVNWFNISGRSYKVIPQVKRVDRLTPSQLEKIYVTGPERAVHPAQHGGDHPQFHRPALAQPVPAAERRDHLGGRLPALDEALKFFENDGASILPKGYVIDYMGESRQLRKEGGNAQFWTTMGLVVMLIFLVLAAQFNSFRDPFVILGGSVPLAIFGARCSCSSSSRPRISRFHRRVDNDVQHLLQGGPGDPRRTNREERDPDR